MNYLIKKNRKFIWQNKKARIGAKYLQDKKVNGGFALPNWLLYYQVSSLVCLKEWITLNKVKTLALERDL